MLDRFARQAESGGDRERQEVRTEENKTLPCVPPRTDQLGVVVVAYSDCECEFMYESTHFL